MLATAKKALLPLALSAAVTAVAGAQQKGKECEVDEGKPGEVARAMLSLQVAQSAAKPEDAAKQLRNAIGSLEKADKTKNPVGENFVLGKTLVMWMSQPNMPNLTTRGAVGFTTNPTQPLDLVVAIDSAFSAVEKAMPECTSQTAAWRAQKGWVSMINEAIQQLNADHADSAEALAKRSLILNPNAPYGYMVLGNLAQKKNQPRQAIDYFKQTVEKSGADTIYADLRRQTMLAAANLATTAAENATGAEKAAYLSDAKWGFETLAQDPKAGTYADQARTGLATLASASGDTAAVKATYAQQLANPSSYSFQQLLNAGVTAARAQQTADATTLFEAAYKKNPYHRDVLYNLAIMYLNGNKYDKVVPIVRGLVSVDPSNGDNYRLFTIAYANEQKVFNDNIKRYNAAAKKAKLPKAIKAYEDSAKFNFDSAKAMADSALKYNTIAEGFPVKVTFNQFATEEDKSTLGGTVSNSSDQTQTYTVKVDFLDASGKTVSSQTATVGPVAAGQTGRFSVTGSGAGIAAFRYAPLVDPSTIKPKG
ncbi:MAG TPA: FxLYD domain-containing protein [Gemmatimonadaceae bacterium]|jgi:tetratricopeptide (TPR) repeat protein